MCKREAAIQGFKSGAEGLRSEMEIDLESGRMGYIRFSGFGLTCCLSVEKQEMNKKMETSV